MLRTEIKTRISETTDLRSEVLRQCHLHAQDLQNITIVRRSLDAREDREPKYVWILDLTVNHEEEYAKQLKKRARIVQPYQYKVPECGSVPLEHRPVVIGFGPAGMAAALLLAKKGYRPLVIERGPSINERQKDVDTYWKGGKLDPEGNVQFGEGGAGAFSDGKLTTRVKDPRVSLIIDELIKAGADPSIAWINHPHIGTEKLCILDENIRKAIIRLKGEVRFNTRLDHINTADGRLSSITLSTGEEIPCEAMVLAIGHSARDTFRMLGTIDGLTLQPKNFAVGVRVEHLQSFINAQQYRAIPDYSLLPPAEYHLSHTSSIGKGVYSFCMCPGGYVVAGASIPDTIVTNGMSYAKRDGTNANSALIIQVDSSDFGEGLYAGMNYQDHLEKNAWILGKGKAPSQTIANYLNASESNVPSSIHPTYPDGVTFTDLHPLFSDPLNQSLTEMLLHTEKIWPGFTCNGALMTGVETRTSSPIRIVRSFQNFESSISGLYPAGEGAGYAGGIVSSAIDGVRCAEQIVMKYAPEK